MRDAKKRLRRTMMFLNAQKPGLIKDPYIYGADSLMLDLEDAVAEPHDGSDFHTDESLCFPVPDLCCHPHLLP